MTLAVKRLIRDVAKRLPEFAHVRASRILVVAGEARRASRATIRPAHFKETRERTRTGGQKKPLIRINGRKILYVITLRPLWFVGSTAEQRLTTVLHELYHVGARFDGTLHRGRRHSVLPRATYDRHMRKLRDRYLAEVPGALAPFAREGLVTARMWLERPSHWYDDDEYGGRRVYSEDQLFYGVMPMRSARAAKRSDATRPKATKARSVH
jgi:predicted metallopeptidase